MEKFNELKTELCDKAKKANACADQYKRALSAQNEAELLNVISDNLEWCIFHECVSHEYFAKFDPKTYLENGIANVGKDNIGYRNTGDRNTGYRNTGDRNTGDRNTGDRNTGYRNTGYRNTGGWNTGDRNTGYSNTGDRNTGVFCTGEKTIKIFNKDSSCTHDQFINSKVYSLLCEIETKMWIWASEMTEEQKIKYPSYKTSDGCLIDIPYKEAFANKWNNWSEANKNEFKNLPNFDKDIFEQITSVKI